jgi:ABC-type nickel/cobalt efflux system permease component RcnA
MQKANKISAFFFLGLFSLMLLHQVFPHLHHQHEESHSHSDIAHSDEHHHHDNDSKEKEDSTSDFFGFFMDSHIHSTVSSDIVVLKRNTVEQQTNNDKDVAKASFVVQQVFSIDYRHNSKPPVYHPPNIYFKSFHSSLNTRGPPYLG